MATDNSPPRLKLIITIGCIVIVTLVGLNFVLTSYFAFMSDQARHDKLAPTTELDEHRKAEQAALTSAKLPIDQAMAQLAKGTRDGLLAPQQSDDLGPMTGWSKLPKQAPEAHPAEPEVTPAGDAGVDGDGGALAADGGVAADGGAALATDGGAAPLTTDAGTVPVPGKDAGVPPTAPTPHH